MGKGMTPKKGYDDKKYSANYGGINWGKKPMVEKPTTPKRKLK